MDRRLFDLGMNHNDGVLRLAPTWVPRSFCRPGKRIKLHPDDYYVLGERGGIDERWLSSTTWAENGPGTPEDEGLSYVLLEDGAEEIRVLLRDFVDFGGAAVLGEALWRKFGKWAMFSKFFDNMGPLPHHIHHGEVHARRVGAAGKPEMYFFPAQMNNHGAEFPFTFFGLNPGTRREELRRVLEGFAAGDNRILELSRAYRLAPDTGWDVPPGILHAPGSLCTYEPQFASDVYAMFQSVLLNGQIVPEALLWKNSPESEIGNIDYLMELVDWEANVDPDFYARRFMKPLPLPGREEEGRRSHLIEWICYRCPLVSAQRLTVYPGQSVLLEDPTPYGLICIQGQGRINRQPLYSPTLIRYGEATWDEYFVSYEGARRGVRFTNSSPGEPLVVLRHFSEHPALPDLSASAGL